MTPAQAALKPCACGGRRQANKSVCLPCWLSAEPSLRAQSMAARTNAEVMTAMHALRQHAATRNTQPSLL